MFSYEENQEAYRYHFARSIKGYGFYVLMTIRCNFSCSICSYSAQHTCDNNWNISYEVIDAFIEKLKGFKKVRVKPVVCLYGGEPTLELDKCEYLAKKVHELDFDVSIFTNGWWGSNPEIRRRIHKNIRPYLIFLSVDNYHNNDVDRDLIPIIDEFQHDTHVVPCSFIGNPKVEKIKSLYPNLRVHEDRILEMGRADYDKDKKVDRTDYGCCHKVACSIKPNGDIGFDCCHDSRISCNFASVFDKDYDLTTCTKNFEYFHVFPYEWWCDEHPEFNCCDDGELPPGVQKYKYVPSKHFSCSNLDYSDLYL